MFKKSAPLKRITPKHGFTLIELLITVLICVVALIAYLSSTASLQRTTEGAYEQIIATQDASRAIEQIRNTANTGIFPGNITSPPSPYQNNAVLPGFANLNGEQVVVSYLNPNADPLDVTATVTWQTNARRQATTSLRTLVTQRA